MRLACHCGPGGAVSIHERFGDGGCESELGLCVAKTFQRRMAMAILITKNKPSTVLGCADPTDTRIIIKMPREKKKNANQ